MAEGGGNADEYGAEVEEMGGYFFAYDSRELTETLEFL